MIKTFFAIPVSDEDKELLEIDYCLFGNAFVEFDHKTQIGRRIDPKDLFIHPNPNKREDKS